ncbi:ribosomal protein S27 [Homo sapiens]|uniref:Ribosomal protein S27 n=1 Tax=Homo sapiens TaxID=9606 RepID=A0A2R8Y731_HUMAN|nr:ribosomal protein S27 [Homo sapiens]KAI2519311.1 ribosomal protein S27 [Homo sapiens]KAI4082837.1 ribosomal protein S27 [Homo sapiens]
MPDINSRDRSGPRATRIDGSGEEIRWRPSCADTRGGEGRALPARKGSPSSLSRRGEEETQEETPGAEPQFLLHGCEMPRML